MNYEISVESHFSAAHRLRGYKGKCENIHGHNWKVEITFSGQKLDKTGMLMDFTDAKKYLKVIMERLDHKDLNLLPSFKKINPTSPFSFGFLTFILIGSTP